MGLGVLLKLVGGEVSELEVSLEELSGELLGCSANEGCCVKLVFVESIGVGVNDGDGAEGSWTWSPVSRSSSRNEGKPRTLLSDLSS